MSSEMMNFINGAGYYYCKLHPPPKLNSSPLKQWWLEGDPFLLGLERPIFRGELLDISGVYLFWVTVGKDWSKTTQPLFHGGIYQMI